MTMKIRKYTALVLLGLLGLAGLRADPWDVAKVGDRPFPVSGTAIDGRSVSLDQFKGKVVLVYLFSTQPGAGMTELMLLERDMWPRYKSAGLQIIGVARDTDARKLAEAVRAMHIEFPLIPDPKKDIFLHYASRGHPRAYLVGKDGTIRLSSLGYSDDELDRISAVVDRELKR
jgi:peroxiredoxin